MPSANLKLLLLQARLADDPMRLHEIACFVERCGVEPDRLHAHNLLQGPPPMAEVRTFDAVMIGGTVMGASVATAAAPGASIALLRSVLITAAVATGVEGVSQDQVALVIVPFFAAFDFVSDRFRTLTNLIGDTLAAFVLTNLFKGDEQEKAA